MANVSCTKKRPSRLASAMFVTKGRTLMPKIPARWEFRCREVGLRPRGASLAVPSVTQRSEINSSVMAETVLRWRPD